MTDTAAGQAPTELELEHHGRRIAAQTWGAQDSPPMLAVHGWLDNAGSFNRLAPLLADQYYIVAIDLAGHGLSEGIPAGSWYSYLDYLSEITAVIERFGWPQCDLLGHSMGGTLMTMWAAAFPERVKRVLCIDALGPLTETADNTATRLRAGLEARQNWQPGPGGRIYPTRDGAIAARGRNGDLTAADTEELATRGLQHLADGYRWRLDRRQRLDSVSRFTEEQAQFALKACTPPTLFIRATESRFKMPEAILAARLAALPAATMVELAGGHHLHIDDAEVVAEHIRRFIDNNEWHEPV